MADETFTWTCCVCGAGLPAGVKTYCSDKCKRIAEKGDRQDAELSKEVRKERPGHTKSEIWERIPKMVEAGYMQVEIAERLGISRERVRQVVDQTGYHEYYKERNPRKAPEREKNPHAVALGRLGGAKGGRVRAANLTPERRREIAVKAVQARWKRYKDECRLRIEGSPGAPEGSG